MWEYEKNWDEAQIYAKLERNKRKIQEGSVYAVLLLIIAIATPILESLLEMGPKASSYYETFLKIDLSIGYSIFARNIWLILKQNKALKQLLEEKERAAQEERKKAALEEKEEVTQEEKEKV